MKRFFITILLLMQFVVIYAQDDKLGGGFFAGYQSGTHTLDVFSYVFNPATQTQEASYESKTPLTFRNSYYVVGHEGYTKNFHWRMSWNIPSWKSKTIYYAAEKQFLLMRFAGGGCIKNMVSILGGAQYVYDQFVFTSKDPLVLGITADYDQTTPEHLNIGNFGGHCLGLNLTFLVLPVKFANFRTTFLFNRVTFKGVPGNNKIGNFQYNGSSVSQEYALYLSVPEIKRYLGVKLAYTHSLMKLKCKDQTTGAKNCIPDNSLNSNYFSISLIYSILKLKDK